MPEYRFEPGMHFLQQGRECVVEDYLPSSKLQIKDLVTCEYTSRPVEELVEALFNGSLEMLGDNNNASFLQAKISKSRVSDLSYLKDDDKRKIEAYRRLEYVQEINRRGIVRFTSKTLLPVAKVVHQKIGDTQNVPSWSSLRRWYKDWKAANEDIRALIPAFKARGNSNHKYSGGRLAEFSENDIERADEVANIIEELVRRKFLRRAGPTVASLHETIEAYIREINVRRRETDKLPIPHINSLYNYIKTLDPYEVDKARHGKKYADQKWRTNQQAARPTRPLERVQFDHTRMDTLVIDNKARLPLGRPWLTSLIDVYTKMIIGIYISFTPPSYLAVMRCLLHAIQPKTYVRKKYPRIEHPWPTYGIPETLIVDNAKEFYSKDFKDVCKRLRIEVEYAPRGAAWFKGVKERFYRTINDALLHALPGTTFSNVIDKKDYDPKKHAIVSIDALLEAVHIWIISIYHQKVHRGIQDVPFRRWCESISEWSPNLPPKNGELKIILGYKDERIISSSGIEFYSLFYNCKELGLIRRQMKTGEKAHFKYDPEDISVLYVFDKHQGEYLPVPALDQDYTCGLTMWQHQVIRNFARKQVQTYVDRDSLCRAKAYLQEVIDSEILTNEKMAGKAKIARYLNIGQSNFVEVLHEGIDANPITAYGTDEFAQLMQGSGNTIHGTGTSDIGNAWSVSQFAGDEQRENSADIKGIFCLKNAASEELHDVDGETDREAENTARDTKPSRLDTAIDDEDEDLDLPELSWSADYDLPT